VEFLDKEEFSDIQSGRRNYMDMVVKVGLKKGGEEFVLVHSEFQGRREKDFAKRMFDYDCLLYLRYGKPIIPIAVFSDDAVWRKPISDTFEIAFNAMSFVRFQYYLIKLKSLDYRQFLDSDNPLAFALMSKMNFNRRQRVRLKADFLRLILGARTDPARKNLLAEFVDAYINLDNQEQRRF
jgi:hypothetical protein